MEMMLGGGKKRRGEEKPEHNSTVGWHSLSRMAMQTNMATRKFVLIPNDTARATPRLQSGSTSLLSLGSPRLYV